jgi:hypothetical protein
MTALPLTAADLQLHVRLGIDADLLDQMQVRRVDDQTARDLLGLNGRRGDLGGVLYPYILPGSTRPVTHRVRRDHPEFEGGKPKSKYLTGYGDRRHLYFATTDPTLLTDASVPAVLVEAEKSALAVTSAVRRCNRCVLAIGLGGCWGWRGRIGKTVDANGARVDEMGPSPDFDRVVWTSRDTIIALDANAAESGQVQAARRALAREVRRRSARVRILTLPMEPGINGPDDFIGRRGDQAFVSLLDGAEDDVLILDPTDPLPSARAFLEDAHLVDGVLSLRHQCGVFYRYASAAYREHDESAVRAALYGFLESARRRSESEGDDGAPALVPFKPTKAKAENVLDALRAVCNLPASFAAPCWLGDDPGLDPFTVMSCRNGLLHIPTRNLRLLTPRFFTLNSLDFEYDPDAAKPERWLQFLHELWGADRTSIDALQEWLGYLLTPDTRFQKIAMLVGP